jgi:hypothetical protein
MANRGWSRAGLERLFGPQPASTLQRFDGFEVDPASGRHQILDVDITS